MQKVSLNEIQAWTPNEVNFIFVNALLPEIFAKSHIPGSINLPIKSPEFNELATHLLPDLNRKIITYCTGPK